MSSESNHVADDSYDSWRAAREFQNNPINTEYYITETIMICNFGHGPDPPPITHYTPITPELYNGVDVENVFLYPQENAKNHHTEKYGLVSEQNIAVIRRAAKFNLAIKTKSRAIDLLTKDDVYITFEFGNNGSASKGTKVTIPVRSFHPETIRNDFSNWKAFVHSQTGNTLVIEVQIRASVPVGIWKLKVETSFKSDSNVKAVFTHPEPIYILFNPYSIHDVVYMDNAKHRDEYVQNDIGKVSR